MQLDTIFWKEDEMFVIKDSSTGVAVKACTLEEATMKLYEVVCFYLMGLYDPEDIVN